MRLPSVIATTSRAVTRRNQSGKPTRTIAPVSATRDCTELGMPIIPAMRRLYLTLFILFIAFSASAQRDFSKVEVKAEKVAGSVYMLTGAGGNIGVSVGDDGIVVIDDQYAPLAPKIEAALKTITDKPVKFILNTHYHGDHTGGNEYFGKSAPIVAHENVRKRLASGVTRRG